MIVADSTEMLEVEVSAGKVQIVTGLPSSSPLPPDEQLKKRVIKRNALRIFNAKF